KVDFDFELEIKNEVFSKENEIVSYKNQVFRHKNIGGSIKDLVENKFKDNLLYFKSNLISDNNLEVFSKNPIELFEKYPDKIGDINIKDLVNNNNIFSRIFDDQVDGETWIFLLNEILDYRKKFNQKMSELIHKGLLANTSKLQKEFNLWQKSNPNILENRSEEHTS